MKRVQVSEGRELPTAHDLEAAAFARELLRRGVPVQDVQTWLSGRNTTAYVYSGQYCLICERPDADGLVSLEEAERAARECPGHE